MGLDDFSESDIEDYVREARIRRNLEDFFKPDDRKDLHNFTEVAEGLEAPKTFARKVASRTSMFGKEHGVFILLGEQDGDLNVVAYDDGDVSVRQDTGHWEVYKDILGSEGLEPELDPQVTQDMPEPFQDEDYSIELGPESQEYIKLRDGGVIGPMTEEFHDSYGEFEQDWNYSTNM